MEVKKTTIAVIFGGRSTEHDVSIVTALSSVIKPLELSQDYQVEAVYVAKNGAWYWDDKLKDISLFSSGSIESFIQKSQPASILFDGGLTLQKTTGIAGRKTNCKIDVAFPAMHGTYGEDGSLNGLLRMANIPFVGCDMDASVLAMDKVLAKQVAIAHKIPTPKMEYAKKNEYNQDPNIFADLVEIGLNYPMFIKPAHLGSSIGITRVQNREELDNALEVAFHYDSKVLAEEAVNNLIEVTLPIIGNSQLRPSLLEKPLTKAEDFFDFETKYMQGGEGGKKGGSKNAQGYSELPAKLDEELYKKAEQTGLAIYKALGCCGIARVDMLIDSKSRIVYFNEINPMPGDLYAHNWRAAGVSGIELVKTLVNFAQENWVETQQLNTVFNTNYLKQF